MVEDTSKLKPVVNDDKKPVTTTPGSEEDVKTKNIIHPIRNVLGKDDNVNFAKNVISVDSHDYWGFDAYPLQLVIDLGEPAKEIDYFRISSGNEQPFKAEFSNDNTETGYSKATSGTLKFGINDVKVSKDIVARYIRFNFEGNKNVDKNKDQKADPLQIYFIQVGQGEINTGAILPQPPGGEPQPEPNTEPPKPASGVIKDNGPDNPAGWGGDYTKGAGKWKAERMRDNAKLYKVVDEKGVNMAHLFSNPEDAQAFITWYQWKQGDAAGPIEEPKPDEPGPGPNPPPVDPNPPTTKGQDQFGTKLMLADGSVVEYKYRENFRDDGKRFDFKVSGAKKGTEAQGYFRFAGGRAVDDEVSIKWSEKSHSGSNEVQCYDSGISIKNGKSRMRFENPHPNYSGNLGGGQGYPLKDKYVGYKGTWVPNADGSVSVTLYQDIGDNEGDKPANEWKKVYEYTDTKYKRSGEHPEITMRIDDPAKKGQKDLEAKWLSVATI